MYIFDDEIQQRQQATLTFDKLQFYMYFYTQVRTIAITFLAVTFHIVDRNRESSSSYIEETQKFL